MNEVLSIGSVEYTKAYGLSLNGMVSWLGLRDFSVQCDFDLAAPFLACGNGTLSMHGMLAFV